MRPWSMSFLLVAGVFAGCFGADPATDELRAVPEGPLVEIPLTIHVVGVGFDAFDQDLLEDRLGATPAKFDWVRAYTTGDRSLKPLQYDVSYQVHEAPAGFAEDLFAFIRSVARPDEAYEDLKSYDRQRHNRICPDQNVAQQVLSGLTDEDGCRLIQRIDAVAVEEWIHEQRDSWGLDFAQPSYTYFALDTQGLWNDTYHQYELLLSTERTRNHDLRAWGGDRDFLFHDLAAGPNSFDRYPWSGTIAAAQDRAGKEDPPIFDLEPEAAMQNLAWNIQDAVDILWARTPIYPAEHHDAYHFPVYFFIDPQTSADPDSPLAMLDPIDVPGRIREDLIHARLAEVLPWADVTSSFHYAYLPEDDPALDAALEDARNRQDGNYIDFDVLKGYFRDNWDAYVAAPEGAPDARVYPAFAFWLDARNVGGGGFSDGDEVGRSWGVFTRFTDAFPCTTESDLMCAPDDRDDPESFWGWLNRHIIHELGHSILLTHPHDRPGLVEQSGQPQVTYELNWLWDSIATPMTYRFVIHDFSHWDQQMVLRSHAALLADRVLRDPDSSEQARGHAWDAVDLLIAGQEARALDAARQARAAGGDAPAYTEMPAQQQTVAIPTTSRPFGQPAFIDTPLFVNLPTPTGTAIPVELPDDADAVRIELREQGDIRHGWDGYAALFDDDGRFLTVAYNGYDVVVWEDLDRCGGGCTLYVAGTSGNQVTFDVTITPLDGPGPYHLPRAGA